MRTNPVPNNYCKGRSLLNQTCADGSYSLSSQYNQDLYLYTRHFKFLKRPGVYLDVATNDPTSISNTFFFDVCLLWSGMCVEANPRYHTAIENLRSCVLVPRCVGSRDGEQVTFSLLGGRSGISDTNLNVPEWEAANMSVPNRTMTCRTLATELRNESVSIIDYFSLDVEGHEMQVLQGIDWRQVRFNVITVEIRNETTSNIEPFLVSKGYVRHIPTLNDNTKKTKLLGEDAVFLHPSVKFGQPV